jgi:hypothetical protein
MRAPGISAGGCVRDALQPRRGDADARSAAARMHGGDGVAMGSRRGDWVGRGDKAGGSGRRDATEGSGGGLRPASSPGRLKPRLEGHEVRLRGLGAGTCASAAGTLSHRFAWTPVAAFRTCGNSPRRRTLRFSSRELIRSWRGLGGPAVCGVPGYLRVRSQYPQPSVRLDASRSVPHGRQQSAQADFACFHRRIHSLLVRTRRTGRVGMASPLSRAVWVVFYRVDIKRTRHRFVQQLHARA